MSRDKMNLHILKIDECRTKVSMWQFEFKNFQYPQSQKLIILLACFPWQLWMYSGSKVCIMEMAQNLCEDKRQDTSESREIIFLHVQSAAQFLHIRLHYNCKNCLFHGGELVTLYHISVQSNQQLETYTWHTGRGKLWEFANSIIFALAQC